MSKNILLIFHSQSGHTKIIADEIAASLNAEEEISLNYKQARDTQIADVLLADGIIICTPEYFGYMSGAVKDFFDRTYDNARNQQVNKPYILFVCCDNDGTGAERSIETIARGYILRKAMDTYILKQKEINYKLDEVKAISIGFANGLKMEIF